MLSKRQSNKYGDMFSVREILKKQFKKTYLRKKMERNAIWVHFYSRNKYKHSTISYESEILHNHYL